jgi:hypothetical protein
MKALQLAINTYKDLNLVNNKSSPSVFGKKLYEILLVMFSLCNTLGTDLFLSIVRTNCNPVSLNTTYSERLETNRTYMSGKKADLKSTKIPI